MTGIENKLIKLKREELISALNNIYAVACGKDIDIESLESNVLRLVKPYIKASIKKRVDLIADFIDSLDELDFDDDIKSLANDISEYIRDAFYKEPLKKFNQDNLEDRLYDLDEISEEKGENLETRLIELMKNLQQYSQDDALNINAYPAIVVGLVKTYERLNDIKRLEFIEILNDHYDEVYDEELASIASESKKRQIECILAKVSKLSLNGQKEFYEDAYEEIVEIYGRIAKEERIKKCEHEFGKWKDCSYTTYVRARIDLMMCDNVPVYNTRFTRKCKHCGFEESVEYVPNEVKIEREEKAKQKEIKSLERRLQKLKGEN